MAAKFSIPQRPLTWLITGCSSGIGLSIVREAQNHGHFVIATSRNPDRTPDLVAEVEAKGGKWVRLDVDDPDCGTVIERLEAEGHAIDVLLNNAAFSLLGVLEGFTEQEVRRQFETALFGPYRLTRAAVPFMRRRRFGVVVHNSTIAALRARESMGLYGAAKAAFDVLLMNMAKEVAEFNIRVLVVSLGSFNTTFGQTCQIASMPVDEDYLDSVADKTIKFMDSGAFVGSGDKDEAAKVICEFVVGDGVGAGHRAETFLPLGIELEGAMVQLRDRYSHALEAFGDLSKGVSLHTAVSFK